MNPSIDITEKVADTEKKLRKYRKEFCHMTLLWLVVLPAFLWAQFHYHGYSSTILAFCAAGLVAGCSLGAFVSLSYVLWSWFMPKWAFKDESNSARHPSSKSEPQD